MKPVYQTKESNCFQATIASLMELPLEVVPFRLKGGLDEQLKCYQKWLRKLGKTLIYIPFNRGWKNNPPYGAMHVPVYCAAGCIFNDDKDGFGHMVVAKLDKRGLRVVHDPSPSPFDPSTYSFDSIFFIVPAIKSTRGHLIKPCENV